VARFGCSMGLSQGPLSGVKRTDRARVTKARRRRPVSALVCSRPPSRTILRDRTAVKCVMDLRGRPEGADSPMIETPTEGVRLTLQFSVDGTLLSVPRVCPTRVAPVQAGTIPPAWEDIVVNTTDYRAMAAEHHRYAGMCRSPESRERHLGLEQQLLALAKLQESSAKAAAVHQLPARIEDPPTSAS
jgi:hypothetical protein